MVGLRWGNVSSTIEYYHHQHPILSPPKRQTSHFNVPPPRSPSLENYTSSNHVKDKERSSSYCFFARTARVVGCCSTFSTLLFALFKIARTQHITSINTFLRLFSNNHLHWLVARDSRSAITGTLPGVCHRVNHVHGERKNTVTVDRYGEEALQWWFIHVSTIERQTSENARNMSSGVS